MPWTSRQPTPEWQVFLDDARTAIDPTPGNVACRAVQGLLQAFRRRLTPQHAIDFAQVLPLKACRPRPAVSAAGAVWGGRAAVRHPAPPGSRDDETAAAQPLCPHPVPASQPDTRQPRPGHSPRPAQSRSASRRQGVPHPPASLTRPRPSPARGPHPPASLTRPLPAAADVRSMPGIGAATPGPRIA